MNDDPAYTIVHEATHIGIDEPIAQRFRLSQPAIEQIVDRFIVDHLETISKPPIGDTCDTRARHTQV
jgi:hypothetical protein